MGNKEVKITISPLGDVSVEAEGFTGTACEEPVKAIANAVSGGGATVAHKPEYYQEGGEKNEIEQGW